LAVLLFLFLAAGAAAPGAQAQDQKLIDALVLQSKARAAIVKAISPAVVHISVEKSVKSDGQQLPEMFNDEFFRRFFQPRLPTPPREFRQRGLGTGSIVSPDGYILTNNHVVADADKITVKLPDGRELEAKLIGADPPTDLAVIQVQGKNLPIIKLGDSDDLDVGESVIAIGNPFGLEQTVTAGIVSAKGRSEVGLTDYEDFIQTDASINPGNSGGPLVNLRGDIVGINTAIYSRSGGNQGIGFAIPVNMARTIMKDLIAGGRVVRGFLGVVIQDVTQELASALNVEVNGGVLVSNVGPDTPAGKAGIKQGDLIVTFNGRPTKSSNALRNAVAATKPGAKIPVELVRDGKRSTVQVTIQEQPKDMSAAIGGVQRPGEEGEPEGPATEELLGMTLQPLTPDVAEQLGYKGFTGLVVTHVTQDSPAAEARLREGVLIMQANRRPVRTVAEFKAVVDSVPSGGHILLFVRLGEFNRFLGIRKP
jgi:serine protease Do